MAELRWILLLAGMMFLAGITVWELRRPRQGRGAVFSHAQRSEPGLGSLTDMEQPTAALASAQTYATASASAAKWEVPAWDTPTRDPEEAPRAVRESRNVRVPLEDPVYVELPPADPAMDAPLLVSFDELASMRAQEIPTLEAREESDGCVDHHELASLPAASDGEVPTIYAADERANIDQRFAQHDGHRPGEPVHDEPVHDERSYDEPGYAESDPNEMQAVVLPAAEPPDPIVDWPPESQRHILAVRVVGLNPDRMAGRPLRQALSACGFVHGRFGIFHQPGADGRALISAANLSRPGVFDPVNMDFERFRGLGLFAVLPGPLPPAAALDHLLDTAGDLAQRLHARLQDEHGMPLDEERLEAMGRIVQGMTQGGLRAEPAA